MATHHNYPHIVAYRNRKHARGACVYGGCENAPRAGLKYCDDHLKSRGDAKLALKMRRLTSEQLREKRRLYQRAIDAIDAETRRRVSE